MPERQYRRARHQRVGKALQCLDGAFLESAECFFAGGTRIVLELDEYRESEDLDFLCSSRSGYRALRSAVTDTSLGAILGTPVPLARDVRADRYGIRTFLDLDGAKLKIEFVNEGRVELRGETCTGVPVPCLDKVSCFAEKFLANADRGNDDATNARDIVDLAFMVEGWGDAPARDGAAMARAAYGEVVDRAARAAATRLCESDAALQRCVAALKVQRVEELRQGLKRLARAGRAARPARKRRAAP